ncbi:phage portal protein [Clostridium kluyveri]|uniref:Phage portal protein n=1 Tax=Clostridium kluyveri TaxID=1534 RepID=A0A1L5FE95_CLOKL|nr:phage portal protein [Clostridium kluyveri]
MKLEKIKRKLLNYQPVKADILKTKSYYENKTDIEQCGVVPKNLESKDPLRNADNRISHNFHQILVDEKVAYMFTYPVLFDIDDNKDINDKVNEILDDDFGRKIKNLAIESSNCGLAWLHYWVDETDSSNKIFKYEKVNTEEVVPIYSNGLERILETVIRTYTCMEPVEYKVEDEAFTYIEYWTNETMDRYKFQGSSFSGSIIEEEKIVHSLGEVPFIEFANNSIKQSDLSRYKKQIDLYDKVKSGYANDLEDIQQIIYILENYGGEDLGEFLSDLKRYKAIKTESDGSGGGVKTLQIEIPVEARKIIIDILRKEIYEFGQGLQQDVEGVGNASGVALKFFYRKLELKSGLLETEFRAGFNKFIRAILKFLNINEYKKIQQTYTRNMISNDLENAQIAQMSSGIIPKALILRNHPWVEDPDEAEKMLQEENKEDERVYGKFPLENNLDGVTNE